MSYRVVSEIRRHGDRVDVPDDAHGVDVAPLDGGQVRVTYLLPSRRLPINADDDGAERDCAYIN